MSDLFHLNRDLFKCKHCTVTSVSISARNYHKNNSVSTTVLSITHWDLFLDDGIATFSETMGDEWEGGIHIHSRYGYGNLAYVTWICLYSSTKQPAYIVAQMSLVAQPYLEQMCNQYQKKPWCSCDVFWGLILCTHVVPCNIIISLYFFMMCVCCECYLVGLGCKCKCQCIYR